MKNSRQKGITLVALVITVIVLLILAAAAVTIALNGDNIFGKANRAVTEWNSKTSEEETRLNSEMEILNGIAGVNSNDITIYVEQIPNESKTGVLLKISSNDCIPTIKEWLQELGNSDKGKENLKNMYAGTMTHGSVIWSQCMSNYTDVTDVWEKQFGGSEGKYSDEYEMIIKERRFVEAEYYIYLAEKSVEEFVKSCTMSELNEMYARGYTNGTANWSQCMSQYTDLKDFYDKTKASSGNYIDEYDYLIKTGFLDVETVNSKYATTTFSCDSQSVKGIKNAQIMVSANGTYKITAEDSNGNNGEVLVEVSDCEDETFVYPQDRNSNFVLNQGNYEAVIPAGYAYGESANVGTISRGLVITDNVNENGKSIGNEFVWIPIDKETLRVVGTETLSYSLFPPIANKGTGMDANGNYIYNYGTDESSLHEPGYINTTEERNLTNREGVVYFQKEFDKMIKSVKTYGGFYIARYEMGLGENYSKLGVTAASASDNETRYWYGLYTKAGNYANSQDDSKKVVSSMIWGVQHSAIIGFAETANYNVKTHQDTNGNHTGKKELTGKYLGSDSILNIYDLEGNMIEWTQKAYSDSYRVARGGGYDKVAGPFDDIRNYSPNSSLSTVGTRISLYIK